MGCPFVPVTNRFNPILVRLQHNIREKAGRPSRFNPILVRLQRGSIGNTSQQDKKGEVSIPSWFDYNEKGFWLPPAFQSHLVRLQHAHAYLLHWVRPKFQSHLGSITTHRASASKTTHNGFNPILVRLQLNISHKDNAQPTRFQSHLGSITTRLWLAPTRIADRSSFQSHLGSITTRSSCASSQRGKRFQSHLGSITTETLFFYLNDLRTFQSHLGSITTRSRSGHLRPLRVSIPSWFDYNQNKRPRYVLQKKRFNPILVRLQRAGARYHTPL
jgi:hypothetical protein